MNHLERTIPAVLADAAQRWPNQPAVVDSGETVTFDQLVARVKDLGKAVIASGLQPGERFAIWAGNSVHWLVASLAAQSVGGVLVPINTRYKGAEAADIIRRSGARLLFVTPPFLDVDYEAMLQGQAVGALAETVQLSPHALTAYQERGSSIGDDELESRQDAIQSTDLSDILYTSGTTGAPKGVMTTHGQNVATFMNWSDAVGLSEGDRYLIVNPFFHSFGYKAGWFAALLRGATSYPLPVFDTDVVLKMIDDDNISFLPGAPTIFQSLLSHPAREEFDLSSLRCAVTGAASVPVQLVRDMKHELGFDEVYTAYGLTESTGVVSLCRSGDDFETIANTSGRAMDGVEVQISDESGQALPPGEAGEVWVRGFNVMKGYLDDPMATAETITADGWLRTGDIGVMNEAGYLKITDRLKDMYICGGFNCYPAEIENILFNHPDIAEVAIKGTPDARMGEVGQAFVVITPGGELTEAEVIAWSREQMANYKTPRKVSFIEALPRNASGKVMKFLLEN